MESDGCMRTCAPSWVSMMLDMDADEGEDNLLWKCASNRTELAYSRLPVAAGDAAVAFEHRVDTDEILKLKGLFLALANLSLRITGNQLDMVECIDPRSGLPVLAGVCLIQEPPPTVGGHVSLTPPPLRLMQAEGGAVGGGALVGRLVVVAAAGIPSQVLARVTHNLSRLIWLLGKDLEIGVLRNASADVASGVQRGEETDTRDQSAGPAKSNEGRGEAGGNKGRGGTPNIGICSGVLQEFLDGRGLPVGVAELLSTYLCAALSEPYHVEDGALEHAFSGLSRCAESNEGRRRSSVEGKGWHLKRALFSANIIFEKQHIKYNTGYSVCSD